MRILMAALFVLASIPLLATPSTFIWIPSPDIQPADVWHLGADSYLFSTGSKVAPFIDDGITYGITSRFEAGLDMVSGQTNPLWLNGKVLLLDPTASPVALVAGFYNVSPKEIYNQQIIYAEAGYTLPAAVGSPRIALGAFTGRKEALRSVLTGAENGILFGIDKSIGKWWLGADYQSGKSYAGAASIGTSYSFSDNTSVLIGYDFWNDPKLIGTPGAFTVQVDINFK